MLSGRLATITASPLAIGTIRVFGSGFFLYGLVTAVQNPERWTSPSYATATAIAAPWVWGVVIGSCGLLALVGSLVKSFLVRNFGLYGIVLWLFVFGIAILEVARRDMHVSYGGPILYGIVCVTICIVARAREGNARARRPPTV